jgi:chromosome segregation ATPase
LQEETSRLKSEVAARRTEHNKLDSDYNLKERTISQLQTKLTLTEQENLRLQTEVAKQKELYALACEQKLRLETDLKEKCTLVEKRETAVKNVQWNIGPT